MISGRTGWLLSADAQGQLQGALGRVGSYFVGTRITVLLLNGLSHLEDSKVAAS